VSQVAIAGVGQVSAAGAGHQALLRALDGARPEPRWLPAFRGADGPLLPMLRAEVGDAKRLVATGAARRLDGFSLPALCAALLASQEGGLGLPSMERVGIVVATGYGALGSTFAFLDDIVDKGDGLASPIHFARSVHNAPAFVMSSALGVTGPTTTLTGFALAWPRALETAIDWLERGTCDRVLLCSADEHHPVPSHALRQLGGWAEDGRMRPLDLATPSYVPGECFTALVLGRPAEVASGWGLLDTPRFFRTQAGAGLDAATESALSEPRALLLAASGNPAEAEGYLAAASSAKAVGAYGGLWGASPTADAMTVLAAVLMLRDGRLRASPDGEQRSAGLALLEPGPVTTGDALGCVSVSSDGRGALVTARLAPSPNGPMPFG
jgi:3-oxoacyl-[acyl-carrier-protein] synthase II